MQMGDKIRAMRLERGLTQYELAGKIGVRDLTVYTWEKGLQEPHKRNRTSLAKFFGITERELMFPDDQDGETENET